MNANLHRSDASSSANPDRARLIAFYHLPSRGDPQGESIRRTVLAAKPLFPGHYQPRVPVADSTLSAFDLPALAHDAEQAHRAGIDAFCFVVDALFSEPLAIVERWARSAAADGLHFCVAWNNEGDQPHAESLSTVTASVLPDAVLRLVRYPHYLRIDNRPLLIVTRLDRLTLPKVYAQALCESFAGADVERPFLAALHDVWRGDPHVQGFDAAIDWPPAGTESAPLNEQAGAARGAIGAVYNYRRLVIDKVAQAAPLFLRWSTVLVDWDDTPARGDVGEAFIRATPGAFAYWLRDVLERASLRLEESRRLVFLRSWNDWPNGCYLQPDGRYGEQRLEALREARQALRNVPSEMQRVHLASTQIPRLASIIVPSYNHASYVAVALDSALQQSWPDVEIIVVDDGSTDQTIHAVRAIAARAQRPLRIIEQANQGAPAAINRGLAEARGEYVAILNSDDLFEPTRLQRCIEALERRKALFAFSDVTFIDERGSPCDERAYYCRGLRENLQRLRGEPFPEIALLSVNCAISTGNFVFRRELVQRIGGMRAFTSVHDWDYALAASHAGRLAFVPEQLYRYRLHGQNTFSANTLRSFFEIEATFLRFFAKLDSHPLWSDPMAGPRLRNAVLQSAHAGSLPHRLHPRTKVSYSDWVLGNQVTTDTLAQQRQECSAWNKRPLFSVLVATFNPPERWLRKALDSVFAQSYPYWELCIADDASTLPAVRALLSDYAAKDARVRVTYRSRNGHISAATNSALELAQGEFIVLLDHDDELAPDALYWVAREIKRYPDSALVYSDEDKIDEQGARSEPYFKPDWNPDLLTGQNCISHLGIYRTALVRELGGFREGCEGAQDWDLALRVAQASDPQRVRHVPRILYHWRIVVGSTATSMDQKGYVVEAQRRVLEDHLTRSGRRGTVERAVRNLFWRIKYARPAPWPSLTVALLVSTHDAAELLRGIDRVRADPAIRESEIVVIPQTEEPGDRPSGDPRLDAIRFIAGLAAPDTDWARALATQASGDLILFLDPGLTPNHGDWLNELIVQALRPEIGAVGPLIIERDGTIAEAGWIGAGSTGFEPAYRSLPDWHFGPGSRAQLVQNLTVPGVRCLMVKRVALLELSAPPMVAPAGLRIVDLCLRLVDQKYFNLWTPFSSLVAPESPVAFRPSFPARGPWAIRWRAYMDCDPAYNVNYLLEPPLFELSTVPRQCIPGTAPLP